MGHDNFLSIERLVEFGFGVGVAQQMVNSMNEALRSSYIPGRNNSLGASPLQVAYHIMIEEKPAGPFSESEVARLVNEQKLTKDTYVWRPGLSKWERAENVPDILKLVALCPPPFTPETSA